jgi:protein SCO1
MSRRHATFLLALPLLLLCSACTHREPLSQFNVVPDFQLTDQTGAPFSSAAKLKGKVWIAGFIFTNCTGPCPRMGTQMRHLQTALADVEDVRLVSFTVDPKRDTPEVLAAYAKRYAAVPGRWFFLTGSPETLNDLSLKAFMLSKLNAEMDHSTRFALVDRGHLVRKYYDTTEPDAIPTLIADAKDLVRAQP